MAIYSKHSGKIINDSISVDSDCWMGSKLVKIRALVEGDIVAKYHWMSDLTADGGKREIEDAIKARSNQ